ncbi:MAG: transposase [Pirellulales bacterium]|nr:transposase [Pirellulales bacterium]
MEPLLPKQRKRTKKGGRPPLALRDVADGVFYVLRTGCQWKAVPKVFGSGSSLHRYFQLWVRKGVFRALWRAGLQEYEAFAGIQWDWQSIDGAMTKAPLGGEKNREKPYRSRQERHEALPAYRWRRRSAGDRRRRRQYA